jgi:hypothetical protein
MQFIPNWLETYFQAWTIRYLGALLPHRSQLEIVGAVVTDDEVNDRTTITISGGGGGSVPTGTGVPSIVGGVQQAAAALITDALVSTTAAIAGTKVSPNFGAQTIATTGFVALGAAPAAAGDVRLSAGCAITAHDSGASYYGLIYGVGDSVYVGTDNAFGHQASGLNVYAASVVAVGLGGATYLYITAGNVEAWKPITGSAMGSSPFSVHGKCTVATAGAFSVAAANYAFDAVQLTGAGGNLVTWPAPATDAAAYYKTVNNTSGATKTHTTGAGSNYAQATGTTARLLFDTAGVHIVGATAAYP